MDSVQNLEDRLRLLIDVVSVSSRRWKELEEATGIAASSWFDSYTGRKRVTLDMVEAVCVVWPQYAFWLSTGISDPRYGHFSPLESSNQNSLPSSTRYFVAELAEKRVREKFAQKWVEEELEEWEGAALRDLGVGAVALVNEITLLMPSSKDEVTQARQEVRLAEQFREVELAAVTVMPKLDFERTKSEVEAIKKVLNALTEVKKLTKEQKATISRINEILAKEGARLERNKEFIDPEN